MKYQAQMIIFVTTCLEMMHKGSGLQCWKCIAHDCDTDPVDNYKASKVKCNDGERCMKVRYRMFDNVTHYDSVIRTCTGNPCDSSSVDEFFKCVATPKQYMIGGCTLRSCCDDRNLCNRGETITGQNLFIGTIGVWILITTVK
ncbi:hypothetical protein ACF0H5_016057 [Mactra antiquata]